MRSEESNREVVCDIDCPRKVEWDGSVGLSELNEQRYRTDKKVNCRVSLVEVRGRETSEVKGVSVVSGETLTYVIYLKTRE